MQARDLNEAAHLAGVLRAVSSLASPIVWTTPRVSWRSWRRRTSSTPHSISGTVATSAPSTTSGSFWFLSELYMCLCSFFVFVFSHVLQFFFFKGAVYFTSPVFSRSVPCRFTVTFHSILCLWLDQLFAIFSTPFCTCYEICCLHKHLRSACASNISQMDIYIFNWFELK